MPCSFLLLVGDDEATTNAKNLLAAPTLHAAAGSNRERVGRGCILGCRNRRDDSSDGNTDSGDACKTCHVNYSCQNF